jgi:hypothetical protein
MPKLTGSYPYDHVAADDVPYPTVFDTNSPALNSKSVTFPFGSVIVASDTRPSPSPSSTHENVVSRPSGSHWQITRPSESYTDDSTSAGAVAVHDDGAVGNDPDE